MPTNKRYQPEYCRRDIGGSTKRVSIKRTEYLRPTDKNAIAIRRAVNAIRAFGDSKFKKIRGIQIDRLESPKTGGQSINGTLYGPSPPAPYPKIRGLGCGVGLMWRFPPPSCSVSKFTRAAPGRSIRLWIPDHRSPIATFCIRR